jgi:Tol biopolymer transport system component
MRGTPLGDGRKGERGMKMRIPIILFFGATLLAACEVPLTGTPETGTAALAVSETPPAGTPQTEPPAGIVRVAYQKPDGPYVWTEGGQPRKLTDSVNTMDATISRDGSAVAYRSDFGLYAVRVEGGEPVMLLDRRDSPDNGGLIGVYQFDFGPDSRYVYFIGAHSALYRVTIDGSSPERIFASGEGGNFTFSPDGEWMTVFHAGEIVLARPDGKEARTAFTYPENSPFDSEGPQIVWAEDSSGFSILSYSGKSKKPQPVTVWFVPVTGEPEQRWDFQGYLSASLSPDGNRAVYFDRHDGTTDVHIADSSGRDVLYASLGDDADLMDWAPDSRRFILNYYQYREDSPAMINVPYICAPGEAPVRLTDTPTAYPARWADNRRVVYSMESAELRLQEVGKPSLLIDDGLLSNAFDLTLLPGE